MRRTRKKKILIAVGILAGVVVLGAVVFKLSLNTITEIGVRKGGSAVLGVPVRLEDADVSLGGSVELYGLELGSPEGYDAAQMFEVDHVHAEVELTSLISDEIVVQNVLIDGPGMIFEFAGGKTNWAVLMEQLQSEAEEQPEQPPETGATGKNMRIDHVMVKNGDVSLVGIPGVNKSTLPLPKVELHDIGKGEESKSVRETMLTLVGNLYKNVLTVLDGVLPAEKVKKLVENTRGVTKKAFEDIGGTGKEAADSVKKSFGDSVGGAAEKGKEALKGLFGGDDKDEEKDKK